MSDQTLTAEERKWLDTWEAKVRQVAASEITVEELFDWAWKKKVLNAINVTIQRIKRAEHPGRDPRRQDNTWVTVAAERGSKKEDLSVLAMRTFASVFTRLKDRGHEFDVDWMATANGVVVISVNVRSLRAYMNRGLRPGAVEARTD